MGLWVLYRKFTALYSDIDLSGRRDWETCWVRPYPCFLKRRGINQNVSAKGKMASKTPSGLCHHLQFHGALMGNNYIGLQPNICKTLEARLVYQVFQTSCCLEGVKIRSPMLKWLIKRTLEKKVAFWILKTVMSNSADCAEKALSLN